MARGVLHESEAVSYDLVMSYVSKMMKTTPDKIAIVEKDGNQFRRAFFSFYSCIIGLKNGYKPFVH